jgi:hypothetical protein
MPPPALPAHTRLLVRVAFYLAILAVLFLFREDLGRLRLPDAAKEAETPLRIEGMAIAPDLIARLVDHYRVE